MRKITSVRVQDPHLQTAKRRIPHAPDPRGTVFCYARCPISLILVYRTPAVKKIVLVYGLLGGVLIAALRLIEYRFLVLEHSLEIYGGIVALMFSALGIWLGLKLTRTRETVVVREVAVPVEVQVQVPVTAVFVRDEQRLEQLGITPREFEILEALAAGLSNREIAGRLFVSENTVKTHAARLFDKLSARRRTQAVQLAKEAGLIP
jgi:two-component system, NarL family, response regulator LiaR